MSKHVVMIIANSPNPSYFNWFAQINAREKTFRFTYIFLSVKPPQEIMERVKQFGVESHWYHFNFAERKQLQFIRVCMQLFFLFRKIKPDVVQTNLFDDSLPGMFAAKLAGVKKRVITKQDTGFHLRYAPKGIRFDIFNNRNATDIIPVSQESYELIMKHEKPDPSKVKIIHHGVDSDFIDSAKPEDIEKLKERFGLKGKIVVGTVARYVALKGYKYIIEAAAQLSKDHPELVFIGAGWGDQKSELDELIRLHNLEKVFLLPGKVEFDLIPALYKCFDMYVHAADYEPFGFVIAEAMFAGVPIISTSVGASRDGLEHRKTAYICQFSDPDDIANGIKFMLASDRKQIAEKARAVAKEKFAKEVMWNNYKALFLGR